MLKTARCRLLPLILACFAWPLPAAQAQQVAARIPAAAHG
jgi:hypothetical protein